MALPVTYAQLVIDYPQFTTSSVGKQREIDTVAFIAQDKYFCVDLWGSYQEQAVVWYLLHLKELEDIAKKTANGTLQSIELQDDGKVAFHKQTQGSSKSWADRLKATYYGGLLLDLYNTLFPPTPTMLVGIARGHTTASHWGHM